MENQLIEGLAGVIPHSEHATDENFELMVRPGFLPRVQVCGGNSKLCQTQKIAVGKLALVRTKEDFVDLGDSVNMIPLTYRFAALDMSDIESVKSYFDPNSAEYKDVQARSEEPDSGCCYGPQFLIWVPTLKEFATFLFGAKSTRPEARKMKARLNQGVTMKSRLITTPQYAWHVPSILPWTSATAVDVPKAEVIAPIAKIFAEEKSSTEDETVTPAAASARPQ